METSEGARAVGGGHAVRSSSIVGMVRLSVESRAGNVAYGWKKSGEWRTLSYVGLWVRVKDFAAGLSGLGVGVGIGSRS